MKAAKTYSDGFEAGWRSVRPMAALPAFMPKPGASDYEAGYAHGVEAAEARLRKKSGS